MLLNIYQGASSILEAHIHKADQPTLKKQEVKVEVEKGFSTSVKRENKE